jgi:putative tryptophan/tyrosine transport system permease protein
MTAGDLSHALVDALETGLPYSIAFAGVWLMFRVLRDFDLTVDATFTSGGAAAGLLLTHGHGAWLSLVAAAVAGGVGGLLTFTVHRALRLPVVLASIVVSVGLYSVNLRLMGTPNVNLLDAHTVTAGWTSMVGAQPGDQWALIALFAIVVVVALGALGYFLTTQFGLGLRASGINPIMARAQGASPAIALLVGLVVANAFVGLSGALVAQDQGFVDISMGVGTIVFGVTAVLLGEVVNRRGGPVRALAAVVLGTLLYRYILAVAFRLGVPPEDFQGMTAIIVLLAVGIGLVGRRLGTWRSRGPELGPLAPAGAAGTQRSSP